MPSQRETASDGDFDHLGQGIGFFRSFADSFWKSTRMELDLVHQEGDSWATIAGRIKGAQCRDLALSRDARIACESCFRETCDRAVRSEGFQSSQCHAGRRFSVRSLGECGGRRLLLLVGRVRVSADAPEEPPARGVAVKSEIEYEAALRLVDLSLPYLTSRLKIESIVADRKLSPLVRKACRYIDRHYREKLSLASVAKACRASEDHLCHAFSQQTGRPITRYISAVRIGHAMYLLSETPMDVTEICFEVGYQSVSQFNRTFRAMKGMSPSRFRKAQHA